MLEALQHHVPGKAMIKADLDHYKYYDNVSGAL